MTGAHSEVRTARLSDALKPPPGRLPSVSASPCSLAMRPTIDREKKQRSQDIPAIPQAAGLIAAIADKFSSDHAITFLPQASVYPWTWSEIDKIFLDSEQLPAETVGIHWFGGAKLANRFNRVLTAENFRKFDSTVCREAGRVIDGK